MTGAMAAVIAAPMAASRTVVSAVSVAIRTFPHLGADRSASPARQSKVLEHTFYLQEARHTKLSTT